MKVQQFNHYIFIIFLILIVLVIRQQLTYFSLVIHNISAWCKYMTLIKNN